MKYSNFHVTVNFNVDDEAHLPRMRRAIEDMAEPQFLWTWLRRYDNGAQRNFAPAERALVDRVRLRAAFEHEGRHNRGLHVHILIEVAHETFVQIDSRGIMDLFRRVVGLNPNVNCRFVRGNGEDKDFILHYITKEVPTYRPAGMLNRRVQSAFSGRNEEVDVDEQI